MSLNQSAQPLQMEVALMESKEEIAQIAIPNSAGSFCKVAEQKQGARTGTASFSTQDSAKIPIFLGPVLRRDVKEDTSKVSLSKLNQPSLPSLPNSNLPTHTLSQQRIPWIMIKVFFYGREKCRKGWKN